jgi:hypothetical protein
MAVQAHQSKEERRAATHERAIAALEDLDWMRHLVVKPAISRSEARSLSAKLRRLLMNGDLRDVASPRIGKIEIDAPLSIDKRGYKKLQFYYAGFYYNDRPTNLVIFKVADEPATPDMSDTNHPLSIDNFLSQNVCCYHDNWICRRDLLKFVAHNASGVHSDNVKSNTEQIIARIRNMFVIRTEKKEGSFMYNVQTPSEKFDYQPNAIDIPSYECLGIAHYLTTSAATLALEAEIANNG